MMMFHTTFRTAHDSRDFTRSSALIEVEMYTTLREIMRQSDTLKLGMTVDSVLTWEVWQIG